MAEESSMWGGGGINLITLETCYDFEYIELNRKKITGATTSLGSTCSYWKHGKPIGVAEGT